MPIFPGPVSHNNPNAPILNAPLNQVIGFGFFDTTAERDSLASGLRVVGYLAIVGSTAFIYEGGTWTDASNWSQIGTTSDGLDNVVEDETPQLGGDLDVNGNSIVSTGNADIVFTPAGTGRVNLDGVVEFKRFPADSPPAAFAGGMYADDNDNLYFGVE